jgi:hypothetical protein
MIQRSNSEKNRQFYDKIVQVGLGIMAIFYVLLGCLVIYKKWLMVNLDQNMAYFLGTVLILYGLFRAYRVFQTLKGMS